MDHLRKITKIPFNNVLLLFSRIVEVGPRDGLQNEPTLIPSNIKINLIDQLSETGLKAIEVTSFVSPKWVPQMADNTEVFRGINRKVGISYPVLVPNMKGLESAISVGAKEVAVFLSASEGFSKKNINCTVQDSLDRVKPVIQEANKRNIHVRGYISCVVGCPYDGAVSPASVSKVAQSLLSMGCYELSLGDTIGIGTKNTIEAMLRDVLTVCPADKLAIHCHETYGQALVNICTALDKGINVVDSSVAGLGGCPYANGATGNVATEDLVYMLHGLGVETGVSLKKLIKAGRFISDFLGKPPQSRVNNVLISKI
ncbi:hydroxymethylglutaryl-CoA lyase, mitochondrial isoform X3 [Anthonomus grandis grandis]|uniref:hydroxymethylglutaryl-CoA lyase, mitochondrial isoform X3 n=1 Tax=Anthonomus grandis grandis TaxID=2921223 RepID=UPI002166A704|nr:hydroxymethylglutaryl-CoA lyase, mitochondrial isoform X3 [Anthonomus grandis grandis]